MKTALRVFLLLGFYGLLTGHSGCQFWVVAPIVPIVPVYHCRPIAVIDYYGRVIGYQNYCGVSSQDDKPLDPQSLAYVHPKLAEAAAKQDLAPYSAKDIMDSYQGISEAAARKVYSLQIAIVENNFEDPKIKSLIDQAIASGLSKINLMNTIHQGLALSEQDRRAIGQVLEVPPVLVEHMEKGLIEQARKIKKIYGNGSI